MILVILAGANNHIFGIRAFIDLIVFQLLNYTDDDDRY